MEENILNNKKEEKKVTPLKEVPEATHHYANIWFRSIIIFGLLAGIFLLTPDRVFREAYKLLLNFTPVPTLLLGTGAIVLGIILAVIAIFMQLPDDRKGIRGFVDATSWFTSLTAILLSVCLAFTSITTVKSNMICRITKEYFFESFGVNEVINLREVEESRALVLEFANRQLEASTEDNPLYSVIFESVLNEVYTASFCKYLNLNERQTSNAVGYYNTYMLTDNIVNMIGTAVKATSDVTDGEMITPEYLDYKIEGVVDSTLSYLSVSVDSMTKAYLVRVLYDSLASEVIQSDV